MTGGPRILHLVNHVRHSGNGIVNAAVDLACCQRGEGAEVALASSGGAFAELLEANGVAHLAMRTGRTLGALWRASGDLREALRAVRPDIVHAHMIAPALLARLARPVAGFRLVTTVHNEFQRTAVLMGVADLVIAVSQAGARSLVDRGVRADKVRVVRNAPLGSVRASAASPCRMTCVDHPAIVTVGGLYLRKGVDLLIGAFHLIADRFPNARLYIVGDGPDRSTFEHAARSGPGAGRIRFEGFRAAPFDYMRAADIFVLASRREPFGLVLAEARAAGAAIVAADVDGIPEVLDDGRAGWLVPPGDPAALAAALHRLLVDADELAAWRARAASGLEWLQVTRMRRETDAVYADALATTRRPRGLWSWRSAPGAGVPPGQPNG